MLNSVKHFFVKDQRRKLRNFVLTSKQLWISVCVCLVSLSSMAVILYISHDVFRAFADIFIDMHGDEGGIVLESFQASVSTLIYISLVYAVIFSIVLFICTIMLTHRFYGPATALKKQLKKMQEKDFNSKVNLRKFDELKDLAKEVNQLADSLSR